MTFNEEGLAICAFGDGRRAKQTVKVKGQPGLFVVCNPCHKQLLAKNKKKRCQYCGVPIVDNWRKSALDGFHHDPTCPRSKSNGETQQ